MPPPTPGRIALTWVLDPLSFVLLVTAAVLYAVGVRRAGAWPRGRTVAFGLGLASVAVASWSGLAAYEEVSFAAHAVQHLLLGLVAPPLLALGAPVTLALRAGPRATVSRVLRSPVARLLARPMVAWTAYVAGPFALYFTPLYALSLRVPAVHLAVHVHFLVAGCLFAWVVLGTDPIPHRPGHGARLLLAALALPYHAFVGVALLSSSRLLAPAAPRPAWLADPLADQHAGAGLMWAGGELVAVAVLLAVLVQWSRADVHAAAREDRATSRT